MTMAIQTTRIVEKKLAHICALGIPLKVDEKIAGTLTYQFSHNGRNLGERMNPPDAVTWLDAFADGLAVGSTLPVEVTIEVQGGLAYAEKCPDHITVHIVDRDHP